MNFLNIVDKKFLITGVANRKSVAYQIAKVLQESGPQTVFSVRSEDRREKVAKLLAGHDVLVCDVEDESQVEHLAQQLSDHAPLAGVVHSIAHADYEDGMKPFHETTKKQFLRAVDISCYSLITLSNALKDLLVEDASVVAISISTTRMASENYGFMAPIKAALDSSIAFLAKSFSKFSRVRFNAVAPGLLKTSASAGIPGYVDAYLFAEQVIPRGEAIQTEEVANVAAFLLSPRSSGINAQCLVIDAGMSINYFDNDIVRRVMESKD